ncbi:MAG: hypothetical protein ABR906_11540 [Terracidiphilus sp.]
MRIAKSKSKICVVVVVFIYREGSAGISGQADLCRSDVFVGMKLHFEIGILRNNGSAAQQQNGCERSECRESVDTAKSHAHGVSLLHLEYAGEES